MTKNNGDDIEPQDSVPGPTVQYEKPKFKRGVDLPVKVKIPNAIAQAAGIGRFLALDKDSEVPSVALEWLKSDSRYSGWFTKK